MPHPTVQEGTSPSPCAPWYDLQFVSRIAAIPVVSSTVGKVAEAYKVYGKESSLPLVKSAIGMAESTAVIVAKTASPYIEGHADTVKNIDDFACRKLTLVEDSINNMPTDFSKDDVKEGMKSFVASSANKVAATIPNVEQSVNTVMSASTSGLEAVRKTAVDATFSVASRVTSTKMQAYQKVEETVCKASDVALAATESFLNRILPEGEKQEQEQEIVNNTDVEEEQEGKTDHEKPVAYVAGSEVGKVINRAHQLVSKSKARAFARAMANLQSVRARSNDAISTFKRFGTDLLAYAATLDEAEMETDVSSQETVDEEEVEEQDDKAEIENEDEAEINPMYKLKVAIDMAKLRRQSKAMAARSIRFGVFSVEAIVKLASATYAKGTEGTLTGVNFLRDSVVYVGDVSRTAFQASAAFAENVKHMYQAYRGPKPGEYEVVFEEVEVIEDVVEEEEEEEDDDANCSVVSDTNDIDQQCKVASPNNGLVLDLDDAIIAGESPAKAI